jgi:hypothetical protein
VGSGSAGNPGETGDQIPSGDPSGNADPNLGDDPNSGATDQQTTDQQTTDQAGGSGETDGSGAGTDTGNGQTSVSTSPTIAAPLKPASTVPDVMTATSAAPSITGNPITATDAASTTTIVAAGGSGGSGSGSGSSNGGSITRQGKNLWKSMERRLPGTLGGLSGVAALALLSSLVLPATATSRAKWLRRFLLLLALAVFAFALFAITRVLRTHPRSNVRLGAKGIGFGALLMFTAVRARVLRQRISELLASAARTYAPGERFSLGRTTPLQRTSQSWRPGQIEQTTLVTGAPIAIATETQPDLGSLPRSLRLPSKGSRHTNSLVRRLRRATMIESLVGLIVVAVSLALFLA